MPNLTMVYITVPVKVAKLYKCPAGQQCIAWFRQTDKELKTIRLLAAWRKSQEQLTVTASKPNFERLARFVDLLGVRSEGQYTPTASPGLATAPCA
jgi:hypothetical protein